ncbi:DNA-directed RNA polymerase subunit H [Thermocladium modestius]|uniref:DNA-directed RNA polymerase subunit Rpo5 n=1 Tax=Thermocladium modestius TaxID=62609 RepID=A0A830GUS9_9CREN|nr:DNA-directed RNA polymerase subunit H [Thermocladium modestius]
MIAQRALDHELVPKAELVPMDEAKAILKKLNVAPWQLPWIRAQDPLIKALGAKPGSVVRIYRKSPTAGEIIFYRIVVSG